MISDLIKTIIITL